MFDQALILSGSSISIEKNTKTIKTSNFLSLTFILFIFISLLSLSACQDTNKMTDPLPPGNTNLNTSLANSNTMMTNSQNFSPDHAVEHLWDSSTEKSPATTSGAGNISSFWIEFDFGKPYDLNQARLFGDAEGSWVSQSWSLETKLAAADAWQPVFSKTNALFNDWSTETLTVTARYARVEVFGDPSIPATQARELEILGDEAVIAMPAPTLIFNADPGQVLPGGETTLSWETTEANSCEASGNWTGVKTIQGTKTRTGITSNQTYNLSCTGDGGTASQSVTVTVTPLPTSRYEVPINLPACDSNNPEVKIIQSNADWSDINNPNYSIFCVKPGDYSGKGLIALTADGTESKPRYIRYYSANDDGKLPWQQSANNRATIINLRFNNANYWIIDRIAVIYTTNSERKMVEFTNNSDYNILNRVLVEKGRTLVQLNKGSDNNTVQNSVIRKSRVKENNGSEAHCFAAMASTISNYNKPNFLNVRNLHLVNNEIYDCTDGIQINRIEKDKASAPGDYSGLVIDNNDFYVTPILYTDGFGNFTPTGDYSCTENAIDIKVGVKSENPSNDEIIRITNNRMWGYKKTDELACPASGSKASVITTHFTDSDYVLVKNNIIFDSENGIWISKPGPGHWSVQNNLFYNVSSPNHVNPWGVLSLDRGGEGRNEAYNNTIIGSVRYLRVGTQAPNGDVRGNVFINAGITGTSAGDPISSTVGYNAYYKSTEYTGNANIGSNIVNSAAGAANNAEYCFTIKRQTAPTQYCIPNAIATKDSPHYIKNTVGGTNNIGVDDLKISTPFYGFDPAALP